MDTFQAISKRASHREYNKRPIDNNLLEKLVDAGRMAPSARAIEPWEFIVITEKTALEQISAMAPNGKFIKDASACIVVFCKETKYYLEDGCAATENILLAAADSYLAACWIAGDKKDYAPDVISMLGAPSDMKLISIISLGWPKKETPQHKTRTLKDVLHWQKF